MLLIILPKFSVNTMIKLMEIKKAWEFLLLAHPCSQAFALPQLKDKQRSQPTPSGIIHTTIQPY